MGCAATKGKREEKYKAPDAIMVASKLGVMSTPRAAYSLANGLEKIQEDPFETPHSNSEQQRQYQSQLKGEQFDCQKGQNSRKKTTLSQFAEDQQQPSQKFQEQEQGEDAQQHMTREMANKLRLPRSHQFVHRISKSNSQSSIGQPEKLNKMRKCSEVIQKNDSALFSIDEAVKRKCSYSPAKSGTSKFNSIRTIKGDIFLLRNVQQSTIMKRRNSKHMRTSSTSIFSPPVLKSIRLARLDTNSINYFEGMRATRSMRFNDE